MRYVRSLERASGIQKQTRLESQNGIVLFNTEVHFFPKFLNSCLRSTYDVKLAQIVTISY